MKVIMLDSEAYQALLGKLNVIENYIHSKKQGEQVDSVTWIDTEEVCRYMNVSKRTVQRYRSKGLIPYSLMGKKIYYPFSEIQNLRTSWMKEASPSKD